MPARLFRRLGVLLFLAQAVAVAAPDFPKHWGEPPRIQTRDYRPLPAGYGFGSSTLGRWIQQNLDRDAAGGAGGARPPGIALGEGATLSGAATVGRPVTLTLEGPPADGARHDYRVAVRFVHRSGAPERQVAATRVAGGEDGKAAPKGETQWRVAFTPEKPGEWIYRVSFRERKPDATDEAGAPVPPFHGRAGRLTVAAEGAPEK